jgi:hypothetical protein
MNTREKAVAIADWLGWQDEDMAAGLRSVADAEKLYDYWQARPDALPEMADEDACDDDGKDLNIAAHRVAALGYDPLQNEG